MIRKIKKVVIENFQSHANTTLSLDGGVVVLAGESSQGKTSVIRAINWVITNRPSGVGYVSHWAVTTNSKGEKVISKGKRCYVALTVEDESGVDHVVERIKSATENKYIVDGQTLEAMGMDVPPDVVKLFSMNETNIQNQDDAYYLLTLSSGQVAQKLNELVHLDTIDEAYSFIHKNKTQASAKYKEYTSQSADLQLKLDGMKNVPQLYEDAKELNELYSDYNERAHKLEVVADMDDVAHDAYQTMKDYVLPELSKDIEKVTDLINDYNDEMYELQSVLMAYLTAESAIKEFESDKTADLYDDIQKVSGLITEYNDKSDNLLKVVSVQLDCSQLLDKLNEADAELNELKEQLPDICPLCGNPIGDNHEDICCK